MIDELATMVADRFNELRQEITAGFAAVRKTLDEHPETLNGHSNRLNRIERKVDSTIARADNHSVRIERLEKAREY